MTTRVHSNEDFGVPNTLGTQIPGPNMDARPRIRRRMPNLQAPLGPSASTSTTSSGAIHRSHPKTSQSPSSHRKTPHGTGPGPKKGPTAIPTETSQRGTRPPSGIDGRPRVPSGGHHRSQASSGGSGRTGATSRRDRGSGSGHREPDDPDGQDVRFIDVAGSSNASLHRSASSRIHTARETHTINPMHILEQSQEQEPDYVYEIELHAAGVGTIENLDMFNKLRVLDLSCNHIRQIENLEYNTDLRELKLYDNDIEDIVNLDRLKELCHLQLQHNRIKTIGKGLQSTKKLRILRLDSNVLCRLEVRDVASCSQLTSLDLSNNKLDNIAAVSCLTNLEELYVLNNRLRTITDLSRCKKLQEVDFSYNKISELSGLKGMPNLMILHASHNQISTVKAVGKLKGLQEINLSNNRLTDTKEIADFYPSLQILDVSENHIETWQNVIKLQKLSELVELYVSGNPFSSANGQKPCYHTDLHKIIPALEILDGAHLKKASQKSGAPVMRPLSAASVLTSRQVETQLKFLDDEMFSFEKNLSSQFESLRSTMEYLPVDSPSRPTSQATGFMASSDGRPTSKSGKRSRIKLAQEFAAQLSMPHGSTHDTPPDDGD